MKQGLQSWLKGIAYRAGFSLKRLRPAPRARSGKGVHESRVRELLHRVDPYEGFVVEEWAGELSGWGSESAAFSELIRELRPRRIIEVGTWLGGSALEMAKRLEEEKVEAEVVCVDTWLGAVEMWTDLVDETRYGALGLRHGYPTIYYRFLANVVREGRQKVITPCPMPSSMAAQWCALRGVEADMIYVDGSHEEDDVYQDLVLWWDRVRVGGVLFGDDWTWDGVRMAVERFAEEQGLEVSHLHDKWVLRHAV